MLHMGFSWVIREDTATRNFDIQGLSIKKKAKVGHIESSHENFKSPERD